MTVETTPTGESNEAGKSNTTPKRLELSAITARYSTRWRRLSQTPAALWRYIPAWLKRWDFALVLALGALLRLLWLDDASFLGDQAELLSLARSALTQHTLLATGIRSSIGALNPPASTYALLPFALSDPYWAALAVALANIIAVILLYGLADRYFGRRAAFAAALLYAVSSGPVSYARFLWQQNLLAPVVILFFWTLLLGVIDQRRYWLGWNVLLWGIAIQLHPTAAPLIALTLAGVYLERKRLRPRDLIFPAVALVVLFAPTLLWELASGASDAYAALGYTGRSSIIDDASGLYLLDLFLPASPSATGSAAAHTLVITGMGWLYWLLLALFAAMQTWLAFSLAAPVVRSLRKEGARATRWQAAYRTTLAEPRWLALALLAGWQDLPILAMLRHSSAVHLHYLLVVLPATFLIAGIFLVRAADWLAAQASVARALARVRLTSVSMRAGASLTLAVIILAGGQGYTSLAQLGDIHTSGAQATLRYGLSLADQRLAVQTAEATASQYHTQAYIATSPLLQESLGYLAATEARQTSVYTGASCLVVPAANGRPLVTLITSSLAASTLAPAVSGTHLLRTLTLSGGAQLPLYMLAPGGHLTGEQNIATAATGAHARQIAPVGYALETTTHGGQLVIHWSGMPSIGAIGQQPATGADARAVYWYGASADGHAPVVANYLFEAQPFDATGHALAAPLQTACGALAWGSGIDVYSEISLPTALATQQRAGRIAQWRLWALAAPLVVSRPTLGPLTLESGDVRFAALAAISGVTNT